MTLVALALVACNDSGSSAPAPTPSPTTAPTPTEVDLGPPEPEVERILEHIEFFSEEVGERPAGSPQEDEVVEYATDQLESWGYEVEVDDFTTNGQDTQRYATVAYGDTELLGTSLFGSPGGTAIGQVIDVGTGEAEDFPADASGMIVLVQRQDVAFQDMATRAIAANAAGMIIANREPGSFPGVLDPPLNIVSVTISLAEGEELRERLAAGQVEAALDVRAQSTAHNVIARPPSGECRTLNGGHPDSVPWAPGANDNASGSAVVLELARAAASAGLDGHCFVLWGGEEGGLQGSRHLVSELTQAEIDTLEGVFNFDAVAGPGTPQLVGATSLSDLAATAGDEIGVDTVVTVLPQNVSSDHAAFLEEGISALLISAPDSGTIHTVNDTFANLIQESLQPIVDLGFALLQELDAP